MTHIAVAGAGAIGCFVGGLLATAGHQVRFLARAETCAEIAAHGLSMTDYSGLEHHLPAPEFSASPGSLAEAELILVTCKTGATAEMAQLIEAHAAPEALIVSLQNGLDAVETLRAALPGRDIRAAMVPFNVVRAAPGAFHRASSGDITVQVGPLPDLSAPGLNWHHHPDIRAVQYGKLLINLNNALNALADIPILSQLEDRTWRRLMADQMAEALHVLRAAGIKPAKTTAAPPRLIPHILRLPTPLFRRIAAQMLTVDPTARTSMWDDLSRRRQTEIGALQGHIEMLGQQIAVPTPINSAIASAIHEAENAGLGPPGLGARALRERIGQADQMER